MRFAALLPFALCLAPFASAQSESSDLRAEIRKIVREEIRAAMKELHGAPAQVVDKVVEVKKGEPMQLRWGTAAPGTGAKASIVFDKSDFAATKVVEGKPLQIDGAEIAEMVKGRLGEMQFHIVSDAPGGKAGNVFVIHPHAGEHEVKVVKGHALQGSTPAECKVECKVECTTECNDAAKAAKSECCEAVKAAAECCEAAKAVSECCKEAKAETECCEGQKCEECVVEVKEVKKLEKAAKKQQKEGGKKKGKKAKAAEPAETLELKIG